MKVADEHDRSSDRDEGGDQENRGTLRFAPTSPIFHEIPQGSPLSYPRRFIAIIAR